MNHDHDIIKIEVRQSLVEKHSLDFLYMHGNYNALQHVSKYIRVDVVADKDVGMDGKTARYTDADGKRWF